MEKISCTYRVRNEEVLQRVKKKRNILRKVNYIGHISCRKCLLNHVTEGKIARRGRRGRRRKQLLDNIKKSRGYWQLKDEALDRTFQGTRCGRGYGPVGKLQGHLAKGRGKGGEEEEEDVSSYWIILRRVEDNGS
jgi:hypothetical protein